MSNKMKVFVDAKGTEIKAGDILYREFYARWRERPGGRRIAINGHSQNETIVNDEGGLLVPKKCWITRKVKWSGACLVAERLDYSDFQDLMQAEGFDSDGDRVYEGSAVLLMNSCFYSETYIINNKRK